MKSYEPKLVPEHLRKHVEYVELIKMIFLERTDDGLYGFI